MTDLLGEIRARDENAVPLCTYRAPDGSVSATFSADRRTLLRLLDATREELADAGKPLGEKSGHLTAEDVHQVTMRLASDGFPFPYDTRHPAACDLLRYGQRCPFDQALDDGGAFPDAPGVYTARIVLARDPGSRDVYAEGPEIHYRRIGDAP